MIPKNSSEISTFFNIASPDLEINKNKFILPNLEKVNDTVTILCTSGDSSLESSYKVC